MRKNGRKNLVFRMIGKTKKDVIYLILKETSIFNREKIINLIEKTPRCKVFSELKSKKIKFSICNLEDFSKIYW